jgi:GMP synthase-like glutamine amidotransferase
MIVVIDNTDGKQREYLLRLTAFLSEHHVPYIVVNKLKDIEKIGNISGFILTGSTYDIPNMTQNHRQNNKYAITSGLPVLGICFGAQFILTHFRGHLRELPEFFCKSVTVDTNTSAFRARFCAHFLPAPPLPKTLVPQATLSKNGVKTVVSFKHASRPIYGTLFHPEYLKSTHFILHEFLELCQKN